MKIFDKCKFVDDDIRNGCENMKIQKDELLKKYISVVCNRNLRLSEDEEKKLEELYLKRIGDINQNMLNSTKIDINKIKKIVSPVSFTDINSKSYLELPIIKSLRIFHNIDEVFLLFTKDVTDRYNQIKEILEKRNIKVRGKEIENELNSVYIYLRELASTQKISEETTVIDITLGLKVVGIALYKIAAERGIKAINWREEYFKEGRNTRNPFNTSLEILQEPMLESLRNRKNINVFLEGAEYKVLSGYYRNLGKDDCADLFEEIDKLFSFSVLLNLDWEEDSIREFRNKIDTFLDFYLKYNKFESTTKDKIGPFISSLLDISKELHRYDVSNELNDNSAESRRYDAIEEKIGDISLNGIESIEVFEDAESDEVTDEFKNLLYYLMYRFLRMKSCNNINGNFMKNVFGIYSTEKLEDLVKKYGIKEKNAIEQLEQVYKNKLDKNNLVECLQFEKRFMEDVETSLMVKNSYLIVDKFGLNIDLYSIDKFKAKNHKVDKRELKNDPTAIVKMINSRRKCYDDSEFFELVTKSKKEDSIYKEEAERQLRSLATNKNKNVEKIIGNYNTRKSNFKEVINFFNEIVREEMKKIGKKSEEFILIEKTQGNLVSIRVNSYFYELE